MSWWRKLLNLPPAGEHWSDQRRTKADQRRGKADHRRTKGDQRRRPPERVPQPGDPEWYAAPGVPVAPPRRAQSGAGTGVMAPPRPAGVPRSQGPPVDAPQRPAQRPGQAPPQQPRRPRETPWQPEPESSFTTWGRRFLRGLVVAVLLLAAISGVRSWIRPPQTTAPPVAAESGYPKDEAKAVAARFATAYLTWDEEDKDGRAAAVAMDLAAGLDASTGWNGRGRQTASTTYPGEVKVDPGGVAAQVDVRVLVTPATKQGAGWAAGKPFWQRLSVPVARTQTRVVVSSAPIFVSDDPAALPDNLPEPGAPDDELTSATQKDAEAFFRAYAKSDSEVIAVAAPGATIRSLNGTVRLERLQEWQVYAGNDDERQATAAVNWIGSGETTLAQSYTLTLRRTVAANGAERWQVAAIG
jgi:hypothetical protein